MKAKRFVIGEGESVFVGGGVWAVHKLFGADTNGAFSVVEHPVEPGVLAAPYHTHGREDEFSIVVDGEIGVWMDGEEFTAKVVDYVIKPRGVPHAFWNAGPEKARLVEIIAPPGFEKYFDEMAELVYADDEEPDFEDAVKLGEKYGLTFHMEDVPEILERHDLTFE